MLFRSAESTVDGALVERKLRALQMLGDPYTDEQIASAVDDVTGRSEMEALIAYLQGLGLARSAR